MEIKMSDSMRKSGSTGNMSSESDMARRVKTGAESMQREASEMGENVARGASDLADAVSSRLKTVGVDTEVMANMAKDQASELQRLLGEELRARPMRALGIAAAVGVFVGLMTAR
jgi:ElaB/YqjD/DUF883 family membrane-anchored ribosome-binding protein